MSAKLKAITFPVASLALFLLLAYLMDRDLFDYLAVMRESGRGREQAAVAETVVTYNHILIDLYDTKGAPQRLDALPATKAVRHVLFRDIGYLRDTGRVLVQDVASLLPVEVKITSPSTAEAVVLEQINYQYQDAEERRPLTDPRGMGRGFRYYLVRGNHRWLVNGWDPVLIEEPVTTEFPF